MHTHLKSIDHVNVVVSDMERSIAFYTRLGFRKTLDLQLTGDWIAAVVGLAGQAVHARSVFLETPNKGARLELIQYMTPEGAALTANTLANTIGIRHFALEVEGLDLMAASLQAEGIPLLSAPQDVPASVGVTAAIGKKRLVYLKDPDGVIIELAQYGIRE